MNPLVAADRAHPHHNRNVTPAARLFLLAQLVFVSVLTAFEDENWVRVEGTVQIVNFNGTDVPVIKADTIEKNRPLPRVSSICSFSLTRCQGSFLSRCTALITTSTARSTCWAVVIRPVEKRTVPLAHSSGTRMDSRTWDRVTVSE